MNITIDELDKTLSKVINDYGSEVIKKADLELERSAFSMLEDIKIKAPKSSYSKKHLADSFIKESKGDGVGKVIYIYSPTKGHIANFVELGFRHRSGKFVAAKPFLRPIYDKEVEHLVSNVKEIIKKEGR